MIRRFVIRHYDPAPRYLGLDYKNNFFYGYRHNIISLYF